MIGGSISKSLIPVTEHTTLRTIIDNISGKGSLDIPGKDTARKSTSSKEASHWEEAFL
ncbi:MAG: hypothetical protein WAN65_31050 [Candidatus Sulfotelmatobacter sp.]